MTTDFIEGLLKDINTSMDKLSGKVTEMWEVSKVKNQITELARQRKTKLVELGSLTYRKTENLENISEEEVNKVVSEIKAINEQISQKKEELDRNIQEAKEKVDNEPDARKEFCPGCGSKIVADDKFCRQCGHKISE